MDYMSVSVAAEKWGVSQRRIHKFCLDGRINGAHKFSGVWQIPEDAQKPFDPRKSNTAPIFPHPLPLMAASFFPGEAQAYIETLTGEENKSVGRCELFYYTGEGRQCVSLARDLMSSDHFNIRYSATLMCGFGYLCAGNAKSAKAQLVRYKQQYRKKILEKVPHSKDEDLYSAFLNNLSTVLLHISNNPYIEIDIKALPGGIRLMALYVLAHRHYLAGEYLQAVELCETALILTDKPYPISEIYLHLMAAVAHMNLQNEERATNHFLKAWEIAEPDDLIEPFSEHHGLLQGMIEVHLRKRAPESYDRIIRQVYVFAGAWRQVHNPIEGGSVADTLTTMEFTIAMLASKGWTNKRIAEHLNLKKTTLCSYIIKIYKKLGINSRRDLPRFMLK